MLGLEELCDDLISQVAFSLFIGEMKPLLKFQALCRVSVYLVVQT